MVPKIRTSPARIADYAAAVEFDSKPGLRAVDLTAAVALLAFVVFAGMTATLMIGFVGAPGGESSACADRCRTYVDVGAGLMFFGTLGAGCVALVLMARSWSRKRSLLIWPVLAIPLLIGVGVVSFLLAVNGPA
ncbi:hypothetical protein FOH10_20535 [Nocardia otitidiscaviarum]|uniref:Uncharacterized protein n=1 Tax=Nocardia otitidiscaviarum TaxID=1823 RepID=A0A516NPA3_9NOCA|nr:hypothetical protein [Nocardia otitidiscaviarum]MCP9623986.1 hypothetical protein [Nocardia otitidiscaviarum]QDP80741.1 hypothetical protein FOH10_20535 [Nocardia otitidiscaviarum]